MRRPRTSAGLALIALLAAALAAACGSAPAQPFRPAGSYQPGPASGQAAPSRISGGLAWPPFGPQTHVIMPGWLPPQAGEDAAVIANKDFLLALLYAEYRGGQDSRWRAYASPRIQAALGHQLAQPDVTTESFTGTIRFSHLSAFPDPVIKGAVDVAQCFDNSRSVNTSIRTGRPVPGRTPADQHYYRTTNVLAPGRTGHWQVVSMYPAVYYPRAPECKP
jgi:hypothetical protein